MSSIAELEAQKEQFRIAFSQGRISKQQYVQAMVHQQELINAEKAKSQKSSASAPLGNAPPAVSGDWRKVTPESPKASQEITEQNRRILEETYGPKKVEPTPSPSVSGIPPAPVNQTSPINFGTKNVAEQTLKGIEETNKLRENPIAYVGEKGLEAGGALAILVAPPVAIGGALVSTGLGEAVSGVVAGRALTVEETRQAFLGGAAFSLISGGAFKAVGSIPKVGSQIVGSGLGRAGISAGLGAGGGYVLSGGDLGEAGKGALLGAGFSLGMDYLARPIGGAIKSRLPQKWGGAERLVKGEPTTGKSLQDVETYVSKEPLKDLGGKKLRVVMDVTENPVGSKGVSLKTMVNEYVGQELPTAHATLKPENFNLRVGGETVLKGFASEGAGFRASQELYHFYSAPGSSEYVTVYGGYAGLASDYSGAKVTFGGKSAVLATTETPISRELLRQSGESIDDYLSRTSRLSGKTGLAQETVLGASQERQFITPAQYERFGEELVGSKYVSGGKVGTFQIKQEPSGVVGKIPIVKDLASRYLSFDVYKGEYAPVTGGEKAAAVVDVPKYNVGYSKVVSVPNQAVSPSVASMVGAAKSPSKVSSPVDFEPSVPSVVKDVVKSPASQSKGNLSVSSMPSFPSYPSSFSESSLPSLPSEPSAPSQPSQPSAPSMPDLPSIPSFPSEPSPPSNPSYSPPPSSPSLPKNLTLPPLDFVPLKPKAMFKDPFILPKFGKVTRVYPVKLPKKAWEEFL